ncbi:MAG: hypothetical protein GY765_14035 [bacterium]|nr:hypothetical protein [bacterium]
MKVFAIILALFLLLPAGTAQVKKSKGPAKKTITPAKESLAWQLDEFFKWIVHTKDMIPRPKTKTVPFYALEQLNLEGSVKENSFKFTIKGSVVAEEAMLIPLFGKPHHVMLQNVTINNQPAVVGFDKYNHYFVRCDMKNFTIRGEMSLRNEMSFSVPGPLNLFTASLSDGRVVEGNRLPGLKNAVIHLAYARKDKAEKSDLPPLFHVARALRVRKEVTFEYRVTARSGSEMSTIQLPLLFSEIVLEVPGIRGWKQQNKQLVVPVSGRNISFTVQGRFAPGALKDHGSFEPDPRSNYEWWLIESDMEHRVRVDTDGKQVDSSESPIPKLLSSPKLFLLTKGQKLNMEIQQLATMDALAVVVSSQTREVTWTREGELVAEDILDYRNNGIDYMAFNCSGKPLYFEIDNKAKKILSENPEDETSLLVPLKKGEHSARVQSISHLEPALFFGVLAIPTASHQLTISRNTIRLGLPSRIVPLWFTGGEGIRSPADVGDVVCVLAALLAVFLFLEQKKSRIAGFIALAGLYFVYAPLFFIILAAAIVIPLVRYIRKKCRGWKCWVNLGAVTVVALAALFIIPNFMTRMDSGSLRYMEKSSYAPGADKNKKEMQVGQRAIPNQQLQLEDKLGNMYFSGKNVVKGVTPVPLPMPDYDRSLSVTRELVTPENPLHPRLIYATRAALYPLLILWLGCLVYMGILVRPRLKPLLENLKGALRNEKKESD